MSFLKSKKNLLMIHMFLLGASISSAQALCVAKSVVPGPGGLPTEEVMACAKDPTNTNVRKAYKDKFCKPDSTYGDFLTKYPVLRDIINAQGSVMANDALLEKIARAFLNEPEDMRYLGVRGLLYNHPLDFLRKQLMGSTRIGYGDMQEYLDPSEIGRGDAKDLTRVKMVKSLIEGQKLQNTEPYKSLYAITNKPLGPSAHKDLSSNPGSRLRDELFKKVGEEMDKVAIGMNANQLVAAMRNGVLKGLEAKGDIIQLLLQEYFSQLGGSRQFADMIRICESIK